MTFWPAYRLLLGMRKVAWLLCLGSLLGTLGLASVKTARADSSSGCNQWGCWYNGGGCNQWGCYNSNHGACNQWGCSNNGACNSHGCPPGPPRGRPRMRSAPPVIVQQVPVPMPQAAPVPPPPPPPDYAQDTGEPADSIREFAQAGLRFEYAQALSTNVATGKTGAYVELRGPRSFSAYILRKTTDRSPEAVRSETTDGMVQDLAQVGRAAAQLQLAL